MRFLLSKLPTWSQQSRSPFTVQPLPLTSSLERICHKSEWERGNSFLRLNVCIFSHLETCRSLESLADIASNYKLEPLRSFSRPLLTSSSSNGGPLPHRCSQVDPKLHLSSRLVKHAPCRCPAGNQEAYQQKRLLFKLAF